MPVIDPQSAVDELRAAGAAEREPVRFGVIDALARRLGTHAGPLRDALMARFDARLAELRARLTESAPSACPASPASSASSAPSATSASPVPDPSPASTASALHALGILVDRLGREPSGGAQPPMPAIAPALRRAAEPPKALKSVAAFERTLVRMRTDRVLRQAQTQVPQRAGPMNSSRVTHQLLQGLRDLSPGYLEAFMAQVDTLLWLEQATGATAVPASRRPGAGAGEKGGLVGGVRPAARPVAQRGASRKRRSASSP